MSNGADFLHSYAKAVANNLLKTDFETLDTIVELIKRTKKTGNRIYIAGNGGSAATASHMANDLVKGARVCGREGFRAICLNDSTPIVTCLANDFCYDDIYSIQLKTYAQKGDLFIVFSGSGNSPNIVNGSKMAREMGLTTIAFGGRDGGKLRNICDYILIAPTNSMEQLEDMHLLYEHAIVSLLQKDLPDLFDIETIRYADIKRTFKVALFDFDGTLSLIREGWQNVMIPYFCEELRKYSSNIEEIESTVRDFVDRITGKQTIYQCIQLVEEIKKRKGTPLDPLDYKREYLCRLNDHIGDRLRALRKNEADPDDYLVPGARAFLEQLKEKGIILYLASGTDENFVLDEASLLKVADYFDGGLYGAQDNYKTFSKELVIRRLIEINDLKGGELLGFGDGFVEIENVRQVNGYAVGVATNEIERKGINTWKRNRLLEAGADIIIPDFSDPERLIRYLLP